MGKHDNNTQAKKGKAESLEDHKTSHSKRTITLL